MSKEPEKKIIAGLNHQSHLTESASVLEPEKKDVWEEFDEKFLKYIVNDESLPYLAIKSFIKTHFIPRAEVVERAKGLKGKNLIWGEVAELAYDQALDDLLDLLTQEK